MAALLYFHTQDLAPDERLLFGWGLPRIGHKGHHDFYELMREMSITDVIALLQDKAQRELNAKRDAMRQAHHDRA